MEERPMIEGLSEFHSEDAVTARWLDNEPIYVTLPEEEDDEEEM